ncbi:MAG: pyridoxal 5'-phosphate synthase glutaminase subunit PdxT [Lachnospiraceae bacterium]|nr:pyridoxal 5'-phosphate synthase glutaminase subunit PdxT [Lachnospiraceae bacterium]
MKVAVLAVQGAFIEHEKVLETLGVESFEIRQKKDLENDFSGIILPGGESTVMGKLLKELDLFEPILEKIKGGLPVLGTCAGLILLAEKLSNDENVYFGTLPVTVKRNAYGRQLGSFYTEEEVKDVGKIPMAFIRAPYIESVGEDVDVLAKVDGNIVGVKYKNQIGISFHPEVTDNNMFHKYFVELVRSYKEK